MNYTVKVNSGTLVIGETTLTTTAVDLVNMMNLNNSMKLELFNKCVDGSVVILDNAVIVDSPTCVISRLINLVEGNEIDDWDGTKLQDDFDAKTWLFKKKISAANVDYFQINGGEFTQPDNSTIEFVVDVIDDTGTAYFTKGTSGSIYMALNGGKLFFANTDANSNEVSGQLTNGKHTVTIRRTVGVNYISVDGGAEETTTSTLPTKIDTISRTTGSNVDFNIYSFTLDGEVFGCDEDNGVTITGDSGTTFTINTGHADGLDYVNEIMLSRYE